MVTHQKIEQRGYDWIIIFVLMVLLGISILGLWSVTVPTQRLPNLLTKHLIVMGIALVVFVLASFYDYQKLLHIAPFLYILMLTLLVLVLFFGKGIGGTRSWFILGSIYFQPSELAKLLLIITLAVHFTKVDATRLRHVFLLGLHMLLPFWLIFKEPDLGTALILVGIFVGMLCVSPAPPFLLIGLLTPMLSLGIYIWNPVAWSAYIIVLLLYILAWYLYQRQRRQETRSGLLKRASLLVVNIVIAQGVQWFWAGLKAYQKKRLLAFIYPAHDPLNSGYQVNQAKIAVGSGSWTGQGLFQGSQTQLQIVPEQHTDFIFSALAEETGFLGSVLIIFLFCVLVVRILMIALRCPNPAGSYICVGVASLLLAHVFVNIGMNMGLMPVTGLPLPLLSYGGTAMVIQLAALGLVENIHLSQRKKGQLTGIET